MTAGPTVSSVPRPSGLVLSPFRALRYDVATAGPLPTLTSPPYDVVDADGVAGLESANEHNVVRLILPREDPDADQDRYEHAAALLVRWREEGVLVPDEVAALHVYEQASPDAVGPDGRTVAGHVQRGLLGALALTPAEDGIVLPHENTMARAVGDRLALYTAVGADLEPIFLVYDGGSGAATRLVATVDAVPPAAEDGGGLGELLVDEVLDDGLRHRLWAVTDPAVLAEVAADLTERRAVIADGHHRYATYLQRQADRHAAGHGPGPWDFGLCLLMDASTFGPQVHPIHRVVPGVPVARLAEQAASGTTVRRLAGGLSAALDELSAAGAGGPAFLLASGDGSELHLVTRPDPDQVAAAVPAGRSAAWAALDVSVLHTLLVGVLWGLPDDVDHVGYAHDVPSALAAAAGSGGTAVLLNPTPVSAVSTVAATGERMPRKSTLFTPKPRTGVVIRDHRDA